MREIDGDGGGGGGTARNQRGGPVARSLIAKSPETDGRKQGSKKGDVALGQVKEEEGAIPNRE